MSYKYKESIKDAVNEVYSPSFADELNRKNELDEVYRKAELADKLVRELKDSSYYVSQGTKDMMISMCLTAIKRYKSGDPSC